MGEIPLEPTANRIPAAKLKWFGTGQGKVQSSAWNEFYYDAIIGTKDWLTEDYRLGIRSTPDPLTFVEGVAHDLWTDPIEFIFSFKKIAADVDFVLNPPEDVLNDPDMELLITAKYTEAVGLVILDATIVGGVIQKFWLKLTEAAAKKVALNEGTVRIAMSRRGVGKIAESVSRFTAMARYTLAEGWSFIGRDAFKLTGDTGFDDILVKTINGEEHFIILESKGNTASLKYIDGSGPVRIKQMSEQWVRDVLRRMRLDGKNELADRLATALDAGRVEGRITWIDFRPNALAPSIRYSYRHYGPSIPQVIKDLYVKASKW